MMFYWYFETIHEETMTSFNLRTINVPNLLKGIKADQTIVAYSAHWGRYLEFVGDGDPAAASTFVAWRQHLIHNTQDSPNTINLRMWSVKAIFRELAEQLHIAKEVSWPIQDVQTLKPNSLPERRNQNFRVKIAPQEMRGIIDTPVVRLGDPLPVRNRAMLLVLATTGMRISEVIHIKVKDIQKSGDHYLVANIRGKGQSTARVAPLSHEAFLAVQDWLHERPLQSEWIFTALVYSGDGTLLYTDQCLTRQGAYTAVKSIAAEYGLPGIKPHDFRRFVGTQLAKTDIRQAQRVLGHKSINTTAKHYVLDEVPLGSTEGLF